MLSSTLFTLLSLNTAAAAMPYMLGPYAIPVEMFPSSSAAYCMLDPNLTISDVSHITVGSSFWALEFTTVTITNDRVVSCVDDTFKVIIATSSGFNETFTIDEQIITGDEVVFYLPRQYGTVVVNVDSTDSVSESNEYDNLYFGVP